ncbi:hypothetical protein [Rheinheimera sp. MMS21-TC3]|uniref:hypothetical protein n=1 Tax=Rheinheimera sp. MMS21-TC3 TaxID=3072790 RepID=UPI0028C4A13A|nr:hypothetical protein [Rheinheimera sp. MMS21-TC3]WNO60431.1 hypothetical protein RDV63_05555 [Rheinheimera sp. MMS21-TC3]
MSQSIHTFKMPDFKVDRADLLNCDTGDRIHDMAKQFAMDIQKKKDDIIKDQLNCYLGRTDWTIEELKGRCECLIPIALPYGKRTETFVIDGVKLVTFHPATQAITQGYPFDSGMTSMRAEFKYQIHGQPGDCRGMRIYAKY